MATGPRQILDINPGSDGDGRKWPKHTYVRNDQYFFDKIAELWIKDLPGGPQADVTYQLNKLPTGYAGFERQRPDSKHVDRYIYGHQRGQFRSLNEFYPHFKQLMDYGNASGCECKQCANGGGTKAEPKAAKRVPATATSEGRPVRAAVQPVIQPFVRTEPQAMAPKRKLVDMEGTPDVYEALIEKLKAAGSGVELDEPIEERLSPDWRTGNDMSKALLSTWKALPRFVPRIGEVVVFVRRLKPGHIIAWNAEEDLFQCFNPENGTWFDPPVWEAGVVTQMPEQGPSEKDLIGDADSNSCLVDASFRIEPISDVGAQKKPHSKQYAYIPLHRIRPFSLWNECISDVQEEWHPTIKHALTITNSVCLVGRYRFKGRWPQATVFCRGAYIGQELIMVGDTVKLLPRLSEQPPDFTTDIMVITAIRFRFVNLDLEETSGIPTPPSEAPYQTCLHLSGRVYTLNPKRAFGHPNPVHVDPITDILPPGVSEYGDHWYHYLDPSDPAARLEIPFTRVLSRCPTDTASKIWFRDVAASDPDHSVRAGGSAVAKRDRPDFQRGLEGATTAHEYSRSKDPRIKDGKSWFWADTRIEQLDLWEVNNRSVGVKDTERTREQMVKWRGSLKAMDEKAGAVGMVKQLKKADEAAKVQSPYGMVAAAVRAADAESEAESPPAGDITADDDDDNDEDDDDDEAGEHEPTISESPEDDADHLDDMELDDPDPTPRQPVMGMMGRAGGTGRARDKVISLDSSEADSDEEDSETDELAQALAKNIRAGGARIG